MRKHLTLSLLSDAILSDSDPTIFHIADPGAAGGTSFSPLHFPSVRPALNFNDGVDRIVGVWPWEIVKSTEQLSFTKQINNPGWVEGDLWDNTPLLRTKFP